VPSRYSVCYEAQQGLGLDRVLATFPRPAEELLRAWDRTRSEYGGPRPEMTFTYWCSSVSTEEARALAQILDDAGAQGQEDIFGLRYDFGQRDPAATEVLLSFEPLLPHYT
jgi:hypothetical protein